MKDYLAQSRAAIGSRGGSASVRRLGSYYSSAPCAVTQELSGNPACTMKKGGNLWQT